MRVTKLRGAAVLMELALLICACTNLARAADVEPNVAKGHVLGEDGKAIAVEGMKISLAISGMTEAAQNVTYTPAVAADGLWSTKLAPGVYHAPRGTIMIPFQGQEFSYELVPEKSSGDFDAKNGLVADFVWHVTGPRPRSGTKPDPENWTHFFGAAVTVRLDRFADGPKTPAFGDDQTKVVFVVEPVSPLIDGTEGKPRTFELAFDKLFLSTKPSKLHDLPVTKYKISGKRIAGDGTETPLRLRGQTDKTWTDTLEFEIANYAGTKEAVGPTIMYQAK